tara:strand:- start:10824 stop:11207 length:384 start_codon:yes stop_codon:yes gene_type:complete
MVAIQAPIIPNIKPVTKPARRPTNFIRNEAGNTDKRLPMKTQANGNVAHASLLAKDRPISGDVAIISEVADIIRARQIDSNKTFLFIATMSSFKTALPISGRFLFQKIPLIMSVEKSVLKLLEISSE